MADRKRSQDGTRETDEYLEDETSGAPSQGGRDGGHLARRVGTRDEKRRAEAEDPGVTRVRKADEIATGADTVSDKEAGRD